MDSESGRSLGIGPVVDDVDTPERRIVDHVRAGALTGDEFATRDLYEVAGIDFAPSQAAGESGEEFGRRLTNNRRRFGNIMELAKKKLGEEFHTFLKSTHRSSYRIVPHESHISTAMRDMRSGIRKELSKGADRVAWFNPLSEEEEKRKERASMEAAHLRMLMDRDRRRKLGSF